MPDWSKSMKQTYEYYLVDRLSWKDTKKLNVVTSCNINRDADVETLGSASIGITDLVGECYIRCYLVTVQNGLREKHPLGTFLCQTPKSTYDGKVRDVTVDAYTPLIELKEDQPPIGYFIPKGEKVMDKAYQLVRDRVGENRVVKTRCDTENYSDFVADPSEKTLSYISSFIANHVYDDRILKYKFGLDDLGRILFMPEQETASMQPVWTYDDSNSSILYPDVTMEHDLFGIPNVVEVSYTKNGKNYYAKVCNNDPDSPLSIKNRGREILYREVDPDLAFGATPTEKMVKEYAVRLLKDLSSPEYSISYTHGYCPVRIGDCVRLNYARAGLTDIKAKVISQSIKCEPGCPVTEKAVFPVKLCKEVVDYETIQ